MRWQSLRAGGLNPIPALIEAIDEVVARELDALAIPRRYVSDIREIWMLQPRFEKRTGQAPFRLLGHLRFRAGYDFLLLRDKVGQTPSGLGAWWTEFIDADDPGRASLIASVKEQQPRAGASKSGGRSRGRRRARAVSSA